ncbi:hypothetical protein [Streptomyces sp. NPDC055013]
MTRDHPGYGGPGGATGFEQLHSGDASSARGTLNRPVVPGGSVTLTVEVAPRVV